uniref:40S ribosomal protein S3a n=1 Tax=Myotis lucifugus TaxID=59463 RepID=G1Q6J0_MYOLU
MEVGKNKHLTKSDRKGSKKTVVGPFSKKDVKAPAMFNIRTIGKTLATRTQGNKIASEGLQGRFEVSLADLQNDEVAFRKKMMEIMIQEVETNDLKEVVNKLIPDRNGRDIEKACQSIHPLHDVFVRKVKMLKKPRFELGTHGEGHSSEKTTGVKTVAKVDQADGYKPPSREYV